MIPFYLAYNESKPDSECFTTVQLTEKQARILFDNTIERMKTLGQSYSTMWRVNYEINDSFDLDAESKKLSPEHYQFAVHVVLDVCQTQPELKDVYEPIKTALMADKRFQAACNAQF